MDLSVCVDISGLDFELRLPRGNAMGRYVVRGYPSSLGDLVSDVDSMEGMLSPLHRVTMPAEAREGAGIPLTATHFAFAHPLEEFEQEVGISLTEDEEWSYRFDVTRDLNDLGYPGTVEFGAKARVREKTSSSPSPSPRRIIRCMAVRSSVNRPRISKTASRLVRKMSRHITGSEAAMRVKSRKPPAA